MIHGDSNPGNYAFQHLCILSQYVHAIYIDISTLILAPYKILEILSLILIIDVTVFTIKGTSFDLRGQRYIL